MLTFENILELFQEYLLHDPEEEVLPCKRGYDMERTICDVLRSRSHIEMQTFQDALKAYARRKDKDLRTLVRYARLFRVEKILRQYLEVLL